MTKYVVTAPYVTLKAKDLAGGTVVREFYKGAPVPEDADPDDVARLLGKGMLEEFTPVGPADPGATVDERPRPDAEPEPKKATAKKAASS